MVYFANDIITVREIGGWLKNNQTITSVFFLKVGRSDSIINLRGRFLDFM